MNGDESYKRQPNLPAVRRVLVALLLTMLGALVGCDEGLEVRVITPDSASSTCIGDPKTPLCTVETMLACLVRDDGRLCEAAMLGSRHQMCRDSPETPGCEAHVEGTLHSRMRSDQVFGYDGLWSFFGDSLHYRVIRTTPVDRAKQPFEVGEIQTKADGPRVDIDVERWVCTAQQSEYFKQFVFPLPLPVDGPGATLAHWIRRQWRRAETAFWEIGLLDEPYHEVWYAVGADYCWERLTYRIAELDGEWLMVSWPAEGPGECEDGCGCSYYRRPSFRKTRPLDADSRCTE